MRWFSELRFSGLHGIRNRASDADMVKFSDWSKSAAHAVDVSGVDDCFVWMREHSVEQLHQPRGAVEINLLPIGSGGSMLPGDCDGASVHSGQICNAAASQKTSGFDADSQRSDHDWLSADATVLPAR